MVNPIPAGLSDSGQLFTIEGLTAAIIMLVSAYIVLGTGMVLTPGDVHISDMQLEQLGNDALLMMETPDTFGGENPLASIVYNASPSRSAMNDAAKNNFNLLFEKYLAMNTGSTVFVDSLRYNSTIYSYNTMSGIVESTHFTNSTEGGDNPGRSPSIRCGRYVTTDWNGAERVVRLEVLIWRD